MKIGCGDKMGSALESMNEQDLFTAYENERTDQLREFILKKYLYIAEIVAKKFVGRGVEFDDLFQVASLALVKAVDRYENTRGVKFASFATPTLVGEIKNYFRDKTRMIRISRRESELIGTCFRTMLRSERCPKSSCFARPVVRL